jgi:enamine deaminase RidA (YjgF/YER057c/UK114 family)
MATISISESQPAIHSAALGLEGLRSVNGQVRVCVAAALATWQVGSEALSATPRRFATRKYADAAMRRGDFDVGSLTRSVLKTDCSGAAGFLFGEGLMQVLQPAEWSKPRGFSHGVVVEGPGKWIMLAGQTGSDEKGDYQDDMAGQVSIALKRIVKLLGEASAGPEHIVRLTWYLTSKSEYEAAGAGIGAAWKETMGRNFPPSTLLYISGLVDPRAKVEIEVTAFVPAN